ncbi:MAG: hypothetical protein PHU97_06160 [Bacteroidales bacterium]|nr:hypothetical protein [Bacteroidales bacterium]MDD3010883.1 hypothetical protein [Bacteroidales bacterium]MDD3962304.1 hypothetical protein [Bacteroidales bacterium]MDY0286172.1 hypothetical protein [Bacteroidales bacterium]HPE87785.1 hypothetical protein [Bacteroidales bacterium]
MKKNIIYFLLVTTALLSACTTGKNALKQGNYYDAVMQSVTRLRQKPDQKDARMVLQQAYPLAITDSKRFIERSIAGTEPLKWNAILFEMERVNQLAEEIYHCPAARQIIPSPLEYGPSTLENAKEQAVKERYQKAKAFLEAGGRENAKTAIMELQKVLDFAPGHSQAMAMLKQAEEMATLHIVVEMLPYQQNKYELSDEAFRNEMNATLAGLDRKYSYIRLYTPEQAEKTNLRPDQIITVDWVAFNVGNSNTRQTEREVTSADSVKVGETTIQGVVYPVYNKVRARLNITSMEIISGGKLTIQAKENATQRILSSAAPEGSYVWRYEWGSFNGDERALSEEEKAICKNRPPVLPSPQFLFTELTKPLYDQTAEWFGQYLKRMQ